MHLIVGLGNPGSEYVGTRHNVGFDAVDRLVRAHAYEPPRRKFHGELYDGTIHVPDRCAQSAPSRPFRCLLLKPLTYMNRSGTAVADAMTFYKLQPSQLLVLVDDTALPCGRIRLRKEGSAGGQNGLKDIEQRLGTRAYPRLRIGIDSHRNLYGPNASGTQKDYVLGRFTPEQRDDVEDAMNLTMRCIETWLSEGIDKAMSLHNATG